MSNPFSEEFDNIYRANFQTLFRTAVRITGNYHDSEELVDEAFVIYFQKSKELKINKPPSYLMGTLSNLIGNYLKSQRREKYVFLPLDAMREIEDPRGLQRPLSDILPDSLQLWEREILIFRYEKKYSFKEISEELNLKEVSCRSRLLRAKAHCRQLMLAEEKFQKDATLLQCEETI